MKHKSIICVQASLYEVLTMFCCGILSRPELLTDQVKLEPPPLPACDSGEYIFILNASWFNDCITVDLNNFNIQKHKVSLQTRLNIPTEYNGQYLNSLK